MESFIRKLFSVVHFLIFCTLMESDFCYSDTKPVILPLIAKQIPNRLRFHHDVSLTVSVTVGSPPQQATMVLDTGSELPWLHCNNATWKNRFNPRISTSYSPVSCSTNTCRTRTRDLTLPVSCNANNLCHVILSYADTSSVEGNLATDIIRVNGSDIPGFIFGCMDSGSSSTPDEDSRTTGLIGMNRGSLSIVSQLNLPQFSYCISGRDDSGLLVFGAANVNLTLKYTPLVTKTTRLPGFDRFAYTVELRGIKVANTVLPIPESVLVPDHTGAGQTMVDSGTQFTFLLGEAYNALKKEFMNQTTHSLKPLNEPNFLFQGAMDLCYQVGSVLPALPTVTLMFGGGAELRVGGGDLLYEVPGEKRGTDSVYCLSFGNSDLLGVEAYLIGHHHQVNKWMEFDLVNSRLGLAEVDCGSASQRADVLRLG